ncbi:FprA family A-type flavoprotein [Desulfonatronum thioautotrophicum]|uniref:FprA family A-type flavoprotein n=1 Tax=Desulfonatronum thioautotrophicum TaxID=617001 RepID=UPI001FC914CD|nr:FprA family A-type flavoprotein [Desulfonatronum thioautotrophicum]
MFLLGAVDWSRRLFDSLIPLPDGTSYNSYLICGSEKTALLDSVDPSMADVLLPQITNRAKIDYIVSHHAEQDHSGSIPMVLEKYPDAKVVCTTKARGMLMDLLHIPEESFHAVEDGSTLSLGTKTLEFIYTPWVHWPETMVTYLREDRMLFSCDFFGSHIASSNMFVVDKGRVHEAGKRYFAEIMMPFRDVIGKNLEKLKKYDIDMIAPSHGLIYDDPAWIMDAWRDWVFAPPKNLVVLPYVSMHESTARMVDHLTSKLVDNGVRVELYDLTVTDIGKLAMSLVDGATIVVGTPTVLAGPHPLAAYATFLANALRPRARYLSIIGSYGWGGKTVETLSAMIPNLKVEVIDPVLCKGLPTKEVFAAIDVMADTIAEKHREQGFS